MAAGQLLARTLAALVILTCGACAQRDLFVVVPDSDGHIGSITVSKPDGTGGRTLNTAYAAASASESGVEDTEVSQQEVETTFGQAIAARPVPPRKFVLYFLSDSENLTPDSIAKFEEVFADIARRPVYEVEVVGHTDRAAEDRYNDPLSLQRAERVRQMLVDRGLEWDHIFATGRGERDPAIPTDDGVHEPLNRRVEVDVR